MADAARTYFVGGFRQRLRPHHEHLEVDDERRRTAQHGVALYDLYARPGEAQCRRHRRPLGTLQLSSNITKHILGYRLVGRHVVDSHLA